MPSVAAALMLFVIRARGSKRLYSSAERTRARVDKIGLAPASYEPPASLRRRVEISRTNDRGWPVFHVSPRGAHSGRAVVYFHGGAYLWEITRTHWKVIAGLAELFPRTTPA